jgi:predicted Zn-dependent protease
LHRPQNPATNVRCIVFAALISAGILFSVNACTVKARTVEPGTIPKIDTLAPGEAAFGKKLYENLCADFDVESDPDRLEGLVSIFDNLILAAEAGHLPWNIYLFEDPETVNVRAVHGNYIFVWSGFLDVAESDDEIAAIMACEIAHVLARHTYPVEFTLWTDIFFDVAELTTSIAIMSATQGVVAISARGWMKWAYVELADLDALDRKYSAEEEREATMIAMLMMEYAQYSPGAMLTFWQRVEQDEELRKKTKALRRGFSPVERTQIIEALLPHTPPVTITPDANNIQTSHRDFNAMESSIR